MGLAGGFGQFKPGDAMHNKFGCGFDAHPVPWRDKEGVNMGTGTEHGSDLFILIHQRNGRAFFRRRFSVGSGEARFSDTNCRKDKIRRY